MDWFDYADPPPPPPLRFGRRHSYGRSSRSESDEELEISDNSSGCSFVLDDHGHQKQKTGRSKIGPLSSGETIQNEEDELGHEINCSSIYIYPSPYKTSSNRPLEINADLKSGRRSDSTAQFAWFHMEDRTMDFDKFKYFIGQRLGNKKSKNLDKLLEDIESHIHPVNVQGRDGLHMDPCFRYYADNRSQKFAGGPRAKTLWLCFPYFSLEQTNASTRKCQSHANKKLGVDFPDPSSRTTQSFSISQFWCLITDDSQFIPQRFREQSNLRIISDDHLVEMFTYGRPQWKALLGPGGPIRVAQSRAYFSDHEGTQDERPKTYIQVLDRGNRMYLLAAESCHSWFEFTVQLHDVAYYEFSHEQWHVYFDQNPVTAENWKELNLVEKAKSGHVLLVLKYQPENSRRFETHAVGPPGRRMMDYWKEAFGSDSDEQRDHAINDSWPLPKNWIHESDKRESSQLDINEGEWKDENDEKLTSEEMVVEQNQRLKSTGQDEKETKVSRGAEEEQVGSQTGGKCSDLEAASNFHGRENGGRKDSWNGKNQPDPEAKDVQGRFHSNTESNGEHRIHSPEPDWVRELDTFRVFPWICATPTRTRFAEDGLKRNNNDALRSHRYGRAEVSLAVDQQKLAWCLQAAHDHLSTKESYMSCLGKNYSQTVWEKKSRLLRYAKRIFELFLPLDHQSAIADKYWGGFERIQSNESVDEVTSKLLRNCAVQSRYFRKAFSNGFGPSVSELIIPDSLYNAFLSATCFMTTYSQKNKEARFAGQEFLRKFERQLRQAYGMVKRSIASVPLSAKEAILPTGILASILEWLLEGACAQEQSKLDDMYQDAVDELENKAYRRAQEEGDEMTLRLLMRDIEKIRELTEDQRGYLSKIERCLSKVTTDDPFVATISAIGKQSATLLRAVKTASFKETLFKDMAQKRAYIEQMHNKNYIARKDDQEAASLTFAIVSVIFLPLTTVASILGMNTREVRDMQQTQWVFWATGIPLAILTGMFCLWCTSRFDKFKQWFRNHLFPRSQSVHTNLTHSEKQADTKVIGLDQGLDSNGEQTSSFRRRWKRAQNPGTQSNNYV